MQSRAELYAINNLQNEIQIIESTGRKNEIPELDLFEKAIVYKYSTDGYQDLNEHLRSTAGQENTEFGELLNEVLAKMPNFRGLVYRTANLNSKQLAAYKDAFKKKIPLTEPSFISTSKVRTFATYLNLNVVFRIMSITGKEINKIAKFGIFELPDENEVLFRFNLRFRVLDITKEEGHTLITMEEV